MRWEYKLSAKVRSLTSEGSVLWLNMEEQSMMIWYEVLGTLLTAVGGVEFFKWLFNRRIEKRLNDLEVKQKEFTLDEQRITELHASIDKSNDLNDNLLQRISNANAALDKQIDRNRELSDRLYKAEPEINRVNDLLTDEQRKAADYEKRLGKASRLIDHYKGWRCEWPDCKDPRGRRPPNPKLAGKEYALPETE